MNNREKCWYPQATETAVNCLWVKRKRLDMFIFYLGL